MSAIKNIMANFKKYQFLMCQLILRDFKIKYKRSVLEKAIKSKLLEKRLECTIEDSVYEEIRQIIEK